MGQCYNSNKAFRLLNIYERLNSGECIKKMEIAKEYHVSEKTIQRDIDELRVYLVESHEYEMETCIKYDKIRNVYYLVRNERECLTNMESLAICKILLESRAFNKSEMNQILTKIIAYASNDDRGRLEAILKNEQFYYAPLCHNKPLLTAIWDLSEYIIKKEIIEIAYTRKDGVARRHDIKPVAIAFSEFYFYLIAYMADGRKDFPTVFRIDRISSYCSHKELFFVPYKNRFSESEFRKRVQFMYSGELKIVEFEYRGPSIESVLDRLPTAEIVNQVNGVFTVRVEVYGDGIYMWLRSQGDYVVVKD